MGTGIIPVERNCDMERVRRLDVGIGEVFFGGEDVMMVARGVGSCVCVCVWSPDRKVGGMAHVLLPKSPPECGFRDKLKYANQAIPTLVAMLERAGAKRGELKAVMAGGARVIHFEDPKRFDVGFRNIEASIGILQEYGIEAVQQDTGGTDGRNITFYPAEGRLDSVSCQKRY